MGRHEYFRRMTRQLIRKVKAERATFVIDNDRSMHETQATVAKIYAELGPEILPKH